MNTHHWPWLCYFLLALSARVSQCLNESEESSEAGSSSVDRSIRAASPLRWGKREPLRWGKRGYVQINPPRYLREAPLRWGKRSSPGLSHQRGLREASPLRWGKRFDDSGDGFKRAPLRWGKRASPMRFGKRDPLRFGKREGSDEDGPRGMEDFMYEDPESLFFPEDL